MLPAYLLRETGLGSHQDPELPKGGANPIFTQKEPLPTPRGAVGAPGAGTGRRGCLSPPRGAMHYHGARVRGCSAGFITQGYEKPPSDQQTRARPSSTAPGTAPQKDEKQNPDGTRTASHPFLVNGEHRLT